MSLASLGPLSKKYLVKNVQNIKSWAQNRWAHWGNQAPEVEGFSTYFSPLCLEVFVPGPMHLVN